MIRSWSCSNRQFSRSSLPSWRSWISGCYPGCLAPVGKPCMVSHTLWNLKIFPAEGLQDFQRCFVSSFPIMRTQIVFVESLWWCDFIGYSVDAPGHCYTSIESGMCADPLPRLTRRTQCCCATTGEAEQETFGKCFAIPDHAPERCPTLGTRTYTILFFFISWVDAIILWNNTFI